MPLSLTLAIFAVVAAVALWLRRGGEGSGWRFAGTAVGLWVGMIVLAIAVVTVATLIFGR